MNPSRLMKLAVIVTTFAGVVGLASVQAQAPKNGSASRQSFVGILTSARPNLKAGAGRPAQGSLRAFGNPPGTPVKKGR